MNAPSPSPFVVTASAAPFWDNPVLWMGLRRQRRGWRAVAVLAAHLLILSCLASLTYWIVRGLVRTAGVSEPEQVAARVVCDVAYVLLLVLASLLSPALAARAIAGERERKTLDLMLLSPLPTHALILGKLGLALACVALLFLAAMPVLIPACVAAAIPWTEVIVGLGILLATSLVTASAGLLFSGAARTSFAALFFTYAAILLLTVVLPLAAFFALPIPGLAFELAVPGAAWLVQAVAVYALGLLICANPFSTAVATRLLADRHGSWLWITEQVVDHHGVPHALPLLSPWIVYVALAAATSALLIAFSVLVVDLRRG